MEIFKSLLWAAISAIVAAVIIGAGVFVSEYFDRRDLQRRLKEEREKK